VLVAAYPGVVRAAADDGVGDLVATFTAANAEALVRDLLRQLGMPAEDLRALQPPADNAMVAVPQLGLVARLGVTAEHHARLARELELAEWLGARGIPATRPVDDPPTAQLVVVAERPLTWWRYLPSREPGTPRDLGALLTQIHAQPEPWPRLPRFDPWARVERQLAAATGLPASDRRTLADRWRLLRESWAASCWPSAERTVIHVDGHPGNVLRVDGTAYLLDLEDARIGPPEWDVAYVMGAWRIGWMSDGDYAGFCDSYGADLRDCDEIEVLVDIGLFRRICWYASRTGREPGIVPAVRHRIATLDQPHHAKHWVAADA
jgi:aminoglycoside phosphotransferase (APT) family kinase protein